MLRKIDRYIIKKFLLTFVYILGIFITIAIIFDISERIDDFIKCDATFWQIISEYYFSFIIFFVNLLSGFLIFISVIFFTSRMASNTEIVAILSGGVSFRRFLLPYFISATLLVMFSLLMNHFLVPRANRIKNRFEQLYITPHLGKSKSNIHIQLSPSERIYFRTFDKERNNGRDFSYKRWENGKLAFKANASVANYDTSSGLWHLRSYTLRHLKDTEEILLTGVTMDTNWTFTPDEFMRRTNSVSAMQTPVLIEYIEEEKVKGSENIPHFLVELYQRSAYPFSTYILTLIGVAIASRKIRGGIGMHLAAGIGLAMTYIFFMRITTVSATQAGLNAFLAVWLPNLMFGILAWLIYRIAPK